MRGFALNMGIVCFSPIIFLSAGSGTKGMQSSSVSSPLLGKTRAAILACAGPPYEERRIGQDLVLQYYKEASMLEGSGVGSKSSVPAIDRGCWAYLLIEQDHVTGIEFRPVPDREIRSDDCRAIFQSCGQ